jgi:hypothetical protein
MVGFSWTGSVTYWAISYGFNNALRALAVSQSGPQFATNSLWQTANLIDSTPVMLTIGILTIISMMLILGRGAKPAMLVQWMGVITGILGHVIFWLAVLTSGGPSAFIQNFSTMSGTTYQALIDAAKTQTQYSGQLWPVGNYSMLVTLSGGITYVALNALGTKSTANIMGEIKEVRKSAFIAIIGALLLLLVLWTITYSAYYYAFTPQFWDAVAAFAPGTTAIPGTSTA